MSDDLPDRAAEGTSVDDAGDSYAAFTRYLDAQAEREERQYSEVATAEGYADLLRDAASSYQQQELFELGQLVQWKPMMRNFPVPLEAVPAIVVAHIDPPVTMDSDGDPLIEPRDLMLGILDGKRVFRLVAVPSARFTRWES